MSIPGSGLLAALRGKSKAAQDPKVADETKFAASSSAVHALEQAIAAGTSPETSKKTPTGCPITSASFSYNLDESHPGEIQPDLTFAPVTRVPADYIEANLRQIAVNDEFITYGLKQGHIRVLHRFSEARALLKGHSVPIADICFVDHDIVAAGGQNGQLYIWKLTVHDGDNAIHVEQITHAKFSPGCDSSPVILAPGIASLAIAVSNAVVVLDVPTEGSTLDGIEIDPFDPAPAKKMPNFPLQDTPTAISISANGEYIAAGSKHGRVYISKVVDGKLQSAATIDADHGHAVSALAWLSVHNGQCTLLVSSRNGCRHSLQTSTTAGSSFVSGGSVMLTVNNDAKCSSFIHTHAVIEQQLVVLTDTPRKAVYTLHWSESNDSNALSFDYLARFKVGMPILNFSAIWDPDAGDDGAIELDCVQTEAVQQYFLDPEICSPSSSSLGASQALLYGKTENGKPSVDTTITQQISEEVSSIAQRADSNADSSVEVCPSPPPSPAAPRIKVEIPQPIPSEEESTMNIIKDEDANAAARTSSSTVATATTPTLLTPTDILRSTTPERAAKSSTKKSTATTAGPTKVLQRGAALPPVPLSVPVPSPAPHIVETDMPKAAERLASASSSTMFAAATAAASNLKGDQGLEVPPGALNDLFLAMKSELAGQRAASEAFLREMLATERAAILAEERASMERAISTISATLSREMQARVQEVVKTELSALTANLGAALAPAVQSAVHAALPSETASAVKGALDKQLGPSLQTALAKPVQDAFKHSFTKQLVPSFENACQSMFLQIDKTFTKGFQEHLEASSAALAEPTALAQSLREALASAASLGDGGVGGSGGRSSSSTATVRSPKVADVKTELKSLIDARRYEEAFSKALGLQDVSTVSWLCTQCDAAALLTSTPPALSQMVLLSLLQQLAADMTQGTSIKLSWIREAAMSLNPRDPLLTPHLKPVLTQVHKSLQGVASRLKPEDAQSCRLAIHVVNSQMAS